MKKAIVKKAQFNCTSLNQDVASLTAQLEEKKFVFAFFTGYIIRTHSIGNS